MKKKCDIITAKKIINEYADKINFYMKQNEVLKAQLDDMTTTLKINKEILYGQLLDNPQSRDYISVLTQLKIENERVSQINQEMNKEKAILESKLTKMQSVYEEKFLNEKSEFDRLNEEIFKLQQKLYEKESALVNLKRETEKNSNYDSIKEIFIADPTKINVELNNELNSTRDIMAKVSKMLNAEKVNNEKLEKKIKQLTEELEEIKNKNINAAQGKHKENNYGNYKINNTCANRDDNFEKEEYNSYNNYSCLTDNNINLNNNYNIKKASCSMIAAGSNNLAFSDGLKILNNKSPKCLLGKNNGNINNKLLNKNSTINSNNEAGSNLNTSSNNLNKNKYNTENPKQKANLSNENSKEFLSSDTDSQKSENGSLHLNFPDKVQMEKKNGHNKSNSFIPKLDFTKVNEKYNNENMKKINIVNNNKIINKPNTKKDREEFLEAENKNFIKLNEKLTKRITKYKNGYNDLKEKYNALKIQFKLCFNKNEVLEMQIKRMTNRQSTEDITNKRFEMVENTSMNHNLSDLYDEQDLEDYDDNHVKTQEKI